jgi:DNA-binding MarR family transcriptional regulator
MTDLILNETAPKIFCMIEDGTYSSLLFQEARGRTYAWITKLAGKFESMGLIRKKQSGKKMTLFLTEKGREVQKLMRRILEVENAKRDKNL